MCEERDAAIEREQRVLERFVESQTTAEDDSVGNQFVALSRVFRQDETGKRNVYSKQ